MFIYTQREFLRLVACGLFGFLKTAAGGVCFRCVGVRRVLLRVRKLQQNTYKQTQTSVSFSHMSASLIVSHRQTDKPRTRERVSKKGPPCSPCSLVPTITRTRHMHTYTQTLSALCGAGIRRCVPCGRDVCCGCLAGRSSGCRVRCLLPPLGVSPHNTSALARSLKLENCMAFLYIKLELKLRF